MIKKYSRTWTVKTQLPVEYSMIECFNLFASTDPNLFGTSKKHNEEKARRLIFIDQNIDRLYGKKIRSYFKRHAIQAHFITIKISEEIKTQKMLFFVLEEIEKFNPLRRKEPVIVIGGGVLMDIVGLASNLYRRGIPYIRVSTSLIGLIDAGIGVKTAVNFQDHKNRIGTYYQPTIVYIDPTFLTTLDSRHIRNGMGEILKIGLMKDVSLFELLEKYGTELLEKKLQNFEISRSVINKAIQGMLEELEPNLWEQNLERLVDFGHTFSGELEMEALPKLLHGEAVSIDMAIVSVIAYQRNYITTHELARILAVMKQLGLPTFHPLCKPELLHKGLEDSASHRDGLQRFPIPVGIGKAKFINNVIYEELISAIETLKLYE